MKNLNTFSYMFGFSIVLLLGMQSCSVSGLVIGSMMDNDYQNDDEIIKQGTEWIKPSKKNLRVSVEMMEGNKVEGKYQGIKTEMEDDEFIDLAVIKTNNMTKSIPIHNIVYTKIYRNKKNWTQRAFIIGFIIDMVIWKAADPWDF